MRISREPETFLSMRAICSEMRRSSGRSSPNILTAIWERTPVTISSTRSAMGCDKTICTPGSAPSRLRISSSISSWERPESGSSSTIGEDSFGPDGSAGDSPRPTLDTTDFTPRISDIHFIASISIRNDSSSEVLGTRIICGVSAPSFIVGMKDFPSSGNSANEIIKSAAAIAIVERRLDMAASSIARYLRLSQAITRVS